MNVEKKLANWQWLARTAVPRHVNIVEVLLQTQSVPEESKPKEPPHENSELQVSDASRKGTRCSLLSGFFMITTPHYLSEMNFTRSRGFP